MSDHEVTARGSAALPWVVAAGMCAGWVAVLPSSALGIALRLKSWHSGDDTSSADYSVIVLSAWVALIVSLVVAGRISDRLAERVGGQARLLLAGVGGVVVTSALLALAPDAVWTGIAWALLQIPAAIVISTSLGWGGQHVHGSRRNLMSGLTGAAPIVALIVGSLVVRSLESPSIGFVALGVIAAVLAVPILVTSRRTAPLVRDTDTTPTPQVGAYLLTFTAVWIAVLIADFLLSVATAITNTYVVALVDSIISAADEVGSVASTAVLLASAIALIASVVSGLLSRNLRRAATSFAVGGLLLAVGVVVVLVWQTSAGLFVSAGLIGAGFGLANGAEMALVLTARLRDGDRGSDLGVLTAITSVPYVLVPLLAIVLASEASASGIRSLYLVAFVAAALAACVSGWIATRRRILR